VATSDYSTQINSAAAAYGLEPTLLAALINQESGGNPYTVNPDSSATGLGQLTRAAVADVFKTTGITVNVFDPTSNITGTAAYLAQQIKATGNIFDGLRAYNQGLSGATNDPNAGAGYANAILANGKSDLPSDKLSLNPVAGSGVVSGQSLADTVKNGLDYVKTKFVDILLILLAIVALFLAVKKMANV